MISRRMRGSQVRRRCPATSAAACAGGFAVSNTNTQVASGNEASGSASYSVTVNFALADDWKFLPATCTAQTFSYLLTAN